MDIPEKHMGRCKHCGEPLKTIIIEVHTFEQFIWNPKTKSYDSNGPYQPAEQGIICPICAETIEGPTPL